MLSNKSLLMSAAIFLLLAATTVFAQPPLPPLSTTAGPTSCLPNPISVSLVGHIEDNDIYYRNCAVYESKRSELLVFAQLIQKYNLTFNLQVSYEWLRGVNECENATMQVDTLGVNVMIYLETQFKFEIDCHQEGASIDHATSNNSFADIVALGLNVTSKITNTTGFQWDNVEQYAAFHNGEPGKLHPEYTFKPDVLAGGVSKLHTKGNFEYDLPDSGAWTPTNFTEADFYTHNPGQRYVYLASGPNQYIADWGDTKKGCHWPTSAAYLKVLATHVHAMTCEGFGTWLVPPTRKLFTFQFMVPGKLILDKTVHYKVEAHLSELSLLKANGTIIIEHLTRTAHRWRTDFGETPNIFRYSQISASEYANCTSADSSASQATSTLPPLPGSANTLPPLSTSGPKSSSTSSVGTQSSSGNLFSASTNNLNNGASSRVVTTALLLGAVFAVVMFL